MRTLQDDINNASNEYKWPKLLAWLARSFKFHDYEASARHRQIQQIELVAKRRDSDLRRRIAKLERRIKQYEFTRGKDEALQANQKEETGTYSEYSSKRTPNFGQV